MIKFYYSEDNGFEQELNVTNFEDALDAGRDILESGDYATSEKSFTVSGVVEEREVDDDGETTTYSETITITIDPEEPDCSDNNDHDWIDGDPWGIGGSAVQNTYTCKTCGLKKIEITNDTQEPGNRNGIRYEF